YRDHKYAHHSVQAPTSGHQITTFALIQRFVVARAETTSHARATMARRNHSIICGPNKVSGRLHGKQRLISIKSAVVLFGQLLDAVEFGNR
ncbi:hypothetical protein T03_14713, partial [Trichinella britovi]